jgi:hypothetical protein
MHPLIGVAIAISLGLFGFSVGSANAVPILSLDWGTSIQAVVEACDQIADLSRKTPVGVQPTMYEWQDHDVTVQIGWGRESSGLERISYLVRDKLSLEDQESTVNEIVAAYNLGDPLFTDSARDVRYWKLSRRTNGDTIVWASKNSLTFCWTATREGKMYVVLYMRGSHVYRWFGTPR